LNEFNQGHRDESVSIFSNTLEGFDGTGFRDKAFTDLYETYKLALALYTGKKIDAQIPAGDQLL
jgi:hypothetical protein